MSDSPKTESDSETERTSLKRKTDDASGNKHAAKRSRRPPRPRATVYSSVAGHDFSRRGPPLTASARPSAPADVLVERFGAPERYAEPQLDWYDAHRFLASRTARRADVYDAATLREGSYRVQPSGRDDVGSTQSRPPRVNLGMQPADPSKLRTQLPDSDLCKAIHRYASGLYAMAQEGTVDPAQGDEIEALTAAASFHSFDETALLAFAILLEEQAAHLVGSGSSVDGEGWRALVAGLDEQHREVPLLRRRSRIKRESDSVEEDASSEAEQSLHHPARKPDVRRKADTKTAGRAMSDGRRAADDDDNDGDGWRARYDADDY